MSEIDVATPSGGTTRIRTDDGLPGHSFPLVAVTAPLIIAGTGVVFLGWSLYESTGAATAVAEVFNGGSSGGELIGGLSLAAGGSSGPSISTRGIWAPAGLYFNVVSGSFTGAIYFRRLG